MEMTFRAFIKKYWLQAVAVLCSTAVFLFWIALRVNWAGISKFLGADHNPSFLVMNLPLLISVLMGVILLLTILSFLCIRDKKRWPYIVSLVCSGGFDGIIAPELTTANTLLKSWLIHAKSTVCGAVIGAQVPIAFTSRFATAEETFLSLAFCAILHDYYKRKGEL